MKARAVSEYKSERESRRAELFNREPRLAELETEIRDTFLSALSNLSPEAVAEASERSLALQAERQDLLFFLGVEPDAMENTPLCPACGDTGYSRGEEGRSEVCFCVLEIYQNLLSSRLSSMLDLRGQSFDSFNLELYSQDIYPDRKRSPRQNMELIYEICVDFSRRFGKHKKNLIFSGAPGTGKTFLSACIAGAVVERGFSVVYDTVAHQLSLLEDDRFGRGGEEAEAGAERLHECDLLIIDDLGTEFFTQFTSSALYELINTRLITSKSTVISTNLMHNELSEKYSKPLVSRLEGEFQWCYFFGDDLRKSVKK